jgi:hypothetical protein
VEPGLAGFKNDDARALRTRVGTWMSAEEADVRALFLYVNPRLAAKSSHPIGGFG